jgi:hypothetical protein
MKPFSRLGFKDPMYLPIMKITLSGIASEFGSTFALVQFSHIMHMIESSTSSFTAKTSNTLRNLLGLLGSVSSLLMIPTCFIIRIECTK